MVEVPRVTEPIPEQFRAAFGTKNFGLARLVHKSTRKVAVALVKGDCCLSWQAGCLESHDKKIRAGTGSQFAGFFTRSKIEMS